MWKQVGVWVWVSEATGIAWTIRQEGQNCFVALVRRTPNALCDYVVVTRGELRAPPPSKRTMRTKWRTLAAAQTAIGALDAIEASRLSGALRERVRRRAVVAGVSDG